MTPTPTPISIILKWWRCPPLEFGHYFIKVILDCAHFLDMCRFEHDNDNEYEYEARGHVGWALPTNIYARHVGSRVGTAHHWITHIFSI
jgi:hypothetical protein